MKRIIRIAILFIILSPQDLSAQGKIWSLEDCINYAVSNNIGLQRQKLQTETAEVNLLKAKMDIFPSLNFGSDGRVGFGRSIDPV
ncbi:MAG TPA: TolC family protein, partial [Bacteroidales bacterium]|nr:TolC family protein [Bacteroidales bacterium]